MAERQNVVVTALHVRQRRLSADAEPTSRVMPCETTQKKWGEHFMKNLSVAAALVICAVVLRTGAIPPLSEGADAVLTAATDQTLLDDRLGRLSFVSAMFPEAVLVFGEQADAELLMPVGSGAVVVHAWSAAEPYTAWRTTGSAVTAAASGEVTGVYHGNGEERLVQVLGEDGFACVYGNLAQVDVQTGNRVYAGETIGRLLPGEDCVFELRQDGRSIDPAAFLSR